LILVIIEEVACMMGVIVDPEQILFEAEIRRRELETAAEVARQVREARGPRQMRRQVGGWLIAAGEALGWQESSDAA
jgi:predicted ATP-grasp superfamily ATP-dependent carboligase